MDWYDYVRIITAILLCIALVIIGYRGFRNWHQYSDYLKDLFIVLTSCLILIAESSIEQIIKDKPLGSSTLFSFLIAVYACVATAKKRGFIRNEPLPKESHTYQVKHRKDKRHEH